MILVMYVTKNNIVQYMDIFWNIHFYLASLKIVNGLSLLVCQWQSYSKLCKSYSSWPAESTPSPCSNPAGIQEQLYANEGGFLFQWPKANLFSLLCS